MPVLYPKSLMGRIRASKLKPVTICLGKDIEWQGGVTQTEQQELLAFMQKMQLAHPVESYAESKHSKMLKKDSEPSANGTAPSHGQNSNSSATNTNKPQPSADSGPKSSKPLKT